MDTSSSRTACTRGHLAFALFICLIFSGLTGQRTRMSHKACCQHAVQKGAASDYIHRTKGEESRNVLLFRLGLHLGRYSATKRPGCLLKHRVWIRKGEPPVMMARPEVPVGETERLDPPTASCSCLYCTRPRPTHVRRSLTDEARTYLSNFACKYPEAPRENQWQSRPTLARGVRVRESC